MFHLKNARFSVRSVLRTFVITLAAILAATGARAADEDYKGEVTGIASLQHFPSGGEGFVGGDIDFSLGRRNSLFSETTYAPLGPSDKLLNFLGGLRIGLPVRSARIVPYVSAFGGMSRYTIENVSQNWATFGAGFGARCLLSRHWGVRPEFRWQRYQEPIRAVNSYGLTMGVFYRFGN